MHAFWWKAPQKEMKRKKEHAYPLVEGAKWRISFRISPSFSVSPGTTKKLQ
jgi:hypothetical protein